MGSPKKTRARGKFVKSNGNKEDSVTGRSAVFRFPCRCVFNTNALSTGLASNGTSQLINTTRCLLCFHLWDQRFDAHLSFSKLRFFTTVARLIAAIAVPSVVPLWNTRGQRVVCHRINATVSAQRQEVMENDLFKNDLYIIVQCWNLVLPIHGTIHVHYFHNNLEHQKEHFSHKSIW